jgi:hypothetical protein
MSRFAANHDMTDTPAFENIQLGTVKKAGEQILASEAQPSPTFSKLGKSRFIVSPLIGNNVVLGVTDGLTVPFALTVGLTAIGSTKIVILAGLAEVVSRSISMGLSTYLGTKSNMDSYRAKERMCDILMESWLEVLLPVCRLHSFVRSTVLSSEF